MPSRRSGTAMHERLGVSNENQELGGPKQDDPAYRKSYTNNVAYGAEYSLWPGRGSNSTFQDRIQRAIEALFPPRWGGSTTALSPESYPAQLLLLSARCSAYKVRACPLGLHADIGLALPFRR